MNAQPGSQVGLRKSSQLLIITSGVIDPMSVPLEVIAKLARSVQPLVFETGIADTPYSVSGTAFLVGYEGHPYVLTTRHSLNPENLSPVCIFPSDISQHLIPLKDVFFVHRNEAPEDFVDLAVIAIDTSRITEAEVAQATLIDLGRASRDWETEAQDYEFVIFGYPADKSFVDYEEQMLHTDRVTLHARYVGRSIIPYLHEIEISEPHVLTTFSGFSGGPVFAWAPRPGMAPALCGMALRGSSSSGRVHFLDRSVLLDALKVKKTHEAYRQN